MSKIAVLIKKTPLKSVWDVGKKSPIGKLYRKYQQKKQREHLDAFLLNELPQQYREHATQPVDESKVIFVEPNYDTLSNNFQLVYKRIAEDSNYHIVEHHLRQIYVTNEEYEENCRKLVEDVATAKYVFLDEASRIIGCLPMRPETKVVQLWHGCGAFKKFGFSTAELIFGPDYETMLRYPQYGNLTYVTVSSPEVAWAYAEAMNIQNPEQVIQPIGNSRTDVFYDEMRKSQAREKLEQLMPLAKGKKVILYAPTFRGRVKRATSALVDVEQFAAAFSKEYVLLIKHHPIVKNPPEIPEEYTGSFAYDMTKDMSIEELLFVADICISDYSSLVFEYSLLERPLIFFAYDLDEYCDWRGFYYNYDELTPGPVLKTNEEMIDYIKNIEDSFDRKQIADFKEKFMSACDGHATDRIMEMVFGE